MNIVAELLRDNSASMRDRIVKYIGSSPGRFEELVIAFLKGPYRVTQRASWPLSYSVEQHPELIHPYLKQTIKNLESPELPIAIKRNTLRLLQFVRIPKPLQGTAARACFVFLTNGKEPVAVRVFSMSVLFNISEKQPGLQQELKMIIEDQFPYGTAGFISRARSILKKMKKL